MNKKNLRGRLILATMTLVGLTVGVNSSEAQKLSSAQAGTISAPTGKIAFIREKNIFVMEANGANQTKTCEAGNADGRLSWAPDNKRIAFTRSGTVDLRGPDMLGGRHKVYDLFVAYTDSAKVGNTLWWNRLTTDLGSRDAEWSQDGNSLIFFKDVNADKASSSYPNYQICMTNAEGGDFQVLRKDWATMTEFLTYPSMNSEGTIAFVHMYNNKPQGMVVLPKSRMMLSIDSIGLLSKKMLGCIAPSWSPDNKWIAYVKSDINKPGIFITKPDLSAQYLVFEPPVGTSLYTMAPSFSPDSKWLTFATTDGSIWIIDITGNSAKRLTGPGLDMAPAWSKPSKK